MNSVLLKLVSFKIGWVASVVSAAAGVPAVGMAVVAGVVLIHLRRSHDAPGETRLLLVAAAIGFVWESLLVSGGLVDYGAASGLAGLAPYWIVGMWVLFATTLNVGMRWLRTSTVLASIAGAVGGPLSFVAGERLGAVAFPDPLLALTVIGAGWAVLLPLIVRFAARDSVRSPVTA